MIVGTVVGENWLCVVVGTVVVVVVCVVVGTVVVSVVGSMVVSSSGCVVVCVHIPVIFAAIDFQLVSRSV